MHYIPRPRNRNFLKYRNYFTTINKETYTLEKSLKRQNPHLPGSEKDHLNRLITNEDFDLVLKIYPQ
jgi:hypothetical protein